MKAIYDEINALTIYALALTAHPNNPHVALSHELSFDNRPLGYYIYDTDHPCYSYKRNAA